MCRIAIIDKRIKDEKFLTELFENLNSEAGGDGLGLGTMYNGNLTIYKGEQLTESHMAQEVVKLDSNIGIFFHCRRASVGKINNDNCHPFTYGDTITIHNGHVEGFGVLKLMMLENIDKYISDGWNKEKVIKTTDSDILAYFIWKHGFEIVSMMACGTVATMYPDMIRIHVGYCLQGIIVNGHWIYASSFTDEMGMLAEKWVIFEKQTELMIDNKGNCILISGNIYDGKIIWAEKNKKSRRGKKKNNIVEVV